MPPQPAPPSDRLTTSNGRSTPVADSPKACPMAAMTSASENTIGDQRAESGRCPPLTPASTTSAVGASRSIERGDEDTVAVILVDEAVAVDVVVARRTDGRHAGCRGGLVGRRVDDEHASLATLADAGISRVGRIAARAEAVVRQGRLEVVEIGAEPAPCSVGTIWRRNASPSDAAAESEGRGKRVQPSSRRSRTRRRRRRTSATASSSRWGPDAVTSSSSGTATIGAVESPPPAQTTSEANRPTRREAVDDHRVGDGVEIEQTVVAAVVQGVRLHLPEQAASRCRRRRDGRRRNRGGGGRRGQGQRGGEHGSPRARVIDIVDHPLRRHPLLARAAPRN